MKKPKVVAILCADIHLSHNPPVWRSNEPDWYAAMRRPLDELQDLQQQYKCPILVAGDVFDLWYGASNKAASELINFAMLHMPKEVCSIPGQHDTPEHNTAQMERSAYYSLVLSKTIRDMEGIETQPLVDFNTYTFAYGEKIEPPDRGLTKTTGQPNIAIVHEYVCTARTAHPKAPKEAFIGKTSNSNLINGKLYGYDVIVYGDNHKGFKAYVGKTVIWNCGTLMRRKSDEEDYKPQVGLLYSDGMVKPHYLDTSKDKHLTADEVKDVEDVEEQDMEQFAEELRKLCASALDFSDAMKEFWRSDKTRKAVRNIIRKAMEK